MNGVVVDIKGKQAALLTEDGTIRKVPDRGYAIGDTIFGQQRGVVPFRRILRYAATAAATLIAVMGIGAGTAYAVPYGTVSVDVNPSIEYTVNVFDYVLSVKGVNADGEAILSELDAKTLKHHPITEAVASTLQQIESEGYFEKEGADVLIAVAAPHAGHAEQLRSDLEQTAAKDMDIPTRSLTATLEDVELAHENGTTAGRLWEKNQSPDQPTENRWEGPAQTFSPEVDPSPLETAGEDPAIPSLTQGPEKPNAEASDDPAQTPALERDGSPQSPADLEQDSPPQAPDCTAQEDWELNRFLSP